MEKDPPHKGPVAVEANGIDVVIECSSAIDLFSEASNEKEMKQQGNSETQPSDLVFNIFLVSAVLKKVPRFCHWCL